MLIGIIPRFSLSLNAKAAEDEISGKTISILGASISTYANTSNGEAAQTTNSTIYNNVSYYPNSVVDDVELGDTWWMQVCEDMNLRLLVNNSWSGSSLLHTRNGTEGAYIDRCVQLHDDTGENAGEEPDIIAIQLGTNDFQYYKDTLGTSDINYSALISKNESGIYEYATPTTSLEAAAIILHKISVRYPNAEVYFLNISQRVDGTDALIQSFNADLKRVVEHFGAHIVDIYGSVITMDEFETYIGDGRVHPNELGMDAYSEAFKRALVDNSFYDISSHKVHFDLSGVTANYGDDKITLSGDALDIILKSDDSIQVSVVMGGADITDTVYSNGRIFIDNIYADVSIKAVSYHESKEYRWGFDGTDLAAHIGDNTLIRKSGTISEGVFYSTRYNLKSAVVLKHDRLWSVEWKCEGTWKNSSSSTGGRMFSSTSVNAEYNARYIFKSSVKWIIALGEKTKAGSHNYGIALADYGIDGSENHVYRLENRIADDGTNMVYLLVDGKEIGPMNNYYIGTTNQNQTSDWLSGKDFTFPHMGTDTHGFSNCSIEYVSVNECTHNYNNGICTACGAEHPNLGNYKGKVISILGASTSTFDGYIPKADGFNLEHRPRYPQSNLLTDVNDTWWMQIINQLDAKLGINDSWAGSTVYWGENMTTKNSDNGEKAAMASLTRIQNLGSNGTPDVIFFFGGGNDIGKGVTLGSFDPVYAPTEVDLTATEWDTFADAYVAAIMRMQHYYPNAEIVAMITYAMPYYVPSEKLDTFAPVMKEICDHYGVECVDLRDSGVTFDMLPDNVHPNAEGMDYITADVLDTILNCVEMNAGDNTIYSVTHTLTNAKADLHYYKGVSAGMPFVEMVTGESVTVIMGGADVTAQVYSYGIINISEVTGDLEIIVKGVFNADGHLQQLPEHVCAGTNLWTALTPENIYYTANGWGNTAAGNSWSITFPVNAQDKIWATSLGAYPSNGSSANGVRVTWFDENGMMLTLDRNTVYNEFAKYGYITAPEGAVALNLPMTNNIDGYAVYIISAKHNYTSTITLPTCTDGGYTTYACKCGESYTGDHVEAVGHSFGEWFVVENATCINEGLEQRNCASCDHFETKIIPASGHSYASTITLPTCTDGGYTTFVCECGESYTGDRVEAMGHSFGEWKSNEESHWRECTVCKAQKSDKKNHTDSDNNGLCDLCSKQMALISDDTGEADENQSANESIIVMFFELLIELIKDIIKVIFGA